MFHKVMAAAGVLFAAASRGIVRKIFPTKPLTMVIPFAAGGPADILGRLMAQRMGEMLGQQVIVENDWRRRRHDRRQTRGAVAPPDGYHLSSSARRHATRTIRRMYKKPLYNAMTDFTPGRPDRRAAARPDRAQGPASQ